MFQYQAHSVRTHDLLEIDAQHLLAAHASAPEWAEEYLRRTPFVVVRRNPATDQNIPVGFRGADRKSAVGRFL
jgi:hypothetical protein